MKHIPLLRTTTLALSTCLLMSCAKPMLKKPPQNAPTDDASIKLAEAAGSVSSSLLELARIEKATRPNHDKNLINPSSFTLQNRASIDWSGPAQELVRRLASSSFYKMRVIGRKPAIPVLISISRKDETIANILRDIDYQIGKKGDIRIYPRTKIIELRYAKT